MVNYNVKTIPVQNHPDIDTQVLAASGVFNTYCIIYNRFLFPALKERTNSLDENIHETTSLIKIFHTKYFCLYF